MAIPATGGLVLALAATVTAQCRLTGPFGDALLKGIGCESHPCLGFKSDVRATPHGCQPIPKRIGSYRRT